MRLQNPASKQKGLTGPNADIVDQLLTNKKKRSRPISSSLEFQASDRTTITTAKSTSVKNKPRVKNQQQPPPQITATRARGSGGIPKIKLQLQDLEGMTEEEIMQALYDDPELAAAASAAASDTNRSQPKEPPPKTTRRQQLSKHSTRAKDMVDQGIPYKQWIILLLLLGVAAYQIYKALKPPQTSKKRGGSKAVFVSKKTKLVGDKGKRKKTETKKSVTKDETKKHTANDESSIPIDKATQDARTRDKASAAKKKKSSVSVAKAASNGKVEKKIRKPESPDSVSTDGSSSTNDAAPLVLKEGKQKKSGDEKSSIGKSDGKKKNGRIEESVEGWQTVSGKPSAVEATAAASSAANGLTKNGDVLEKSHIGRPEKGKTASLADKNVEVDANKENAKAQVDDLSEVPSKGDTAAEKAKRLRKKKAKAANAVASAVISTPTTDDDATIALKLQIEEENFAVASDRAESEPEVWREVATKKRKGTGPMEATDPVAVVEGTI